MHAWLRPLVGPRFQVLFHSPPGVLFTFPSRYCALSVAAEYSALEGGPPGFRQDSSCPAVLRLRVHAGACVSRTGLSPAPAGLPRTVPLRTRFLTARGSPPRRAPTTPRARRPPVWAPPRSLAATGGISFDFFSRWYLDGSLPSVSPAHGYVFTAARGCHSRTSGLPRSDTRGSKGIGPSPRLFAACRVLHRLAAPRHPPQTLFSLDHIILPIPTLTHQKKTNGGKGTRTPDPRLAKPML